LTLLSAVSRDSDSHYIIEHKQMSIELIILITNIIIASSYLDSLQD